MFLPAVQVNIFIIIVAVLGLPASHVIGNHNLLQILYLRTTQILYLRTEPIEIVQNFDVSKYGEKLLWLDGQRNLSFTHTGTSTVVCVRKLFL